MFDNIITKNNGFLRMSMSNRAFISTGVEIGRRLRTRGSVGPIKTHFNDLVRVYLRLSQG